MSRTNTMIKYLLGTFASLLMLAGADTAVAQPFAYVTSTNTVTVINTATNAVVKTISVAGSNLGVKFRPAGDRAYVVNNSFSTVAVIDAATGAVVATVPVGGSPQSTAVKPDGSRVYVSNSADNTVSVIDTSTNTVIGIPIAVGSQPVGLAVSPDGSRLYVGNASGSSVTVIDTSTNLPVVGSPVTVGPRPNDIVFKPDGTRAYVTNNSGSSMSVIDTSSLTATTVPLGVAPCDIAIDPSGSRLYITTCNNANTILVLDTVTYSPVLGSPVTGGSYPKGVAVNAAGTFAYAANLLSNTVSVINTSTNMAVFVPAGSSPTQIAINPTSSAMVPDAPIIGTATAGVGSATVNYTAPAFDGGSPITSYTAKSNPGNITGSATSGSITVTGLTNGTAYTFTVTATNAVGSSTPSAASNSVTPSAPSATYAPPAGLDFGMRTVGVVSPSMQGTFTNTSAVSLVVSSVSFSGGGAGFNVLGSSQCLAPTLILAPAASCTFDITSQPNAVGILTDSVYVLTSPANAAVPPALPLTVTGVAPSPIVATVTNAADSGPGSLRQAITVANAGGFCAPSATINFSMGTGPYVISPGSPLPTVSCANTIIDGYTQAGTSANTLGSGNNATILVTLDGTLMTPPAPGLVLSGNNSVVRGMVIRKFIGQPGISIQSGIGVKIEGNFIGTDAAGTGALPNGVGIDISGNLAAIGNPTPAGRNVISGNVGDGIAVNGTGARIRNNHIGTDKTGGSPLPNGGNGVHLNSANAEIDSNFVKFNAGNGVAIGASGGSANIHGNDIFGNGSNGVYLLGTECTAQGVSIRRNNIGIQGALGIDLGDIYAITPVRDNNGVLSSPNCYHGNGGSATMGQNFPVIGGVSYAWNGASVVTTVNAVLGSAPGTVYDIDLFNNLSALDVTNQGIGAQYVASLATAATDATGSVVIPFAVSGAPVYHPTMTATTPVGPNGGTSEFSVQAITPLFYASTYSPFAITAGGNQSQTFTFVNADTVPVAVPLPTSSSPGRFTVTSSTCASVPSGGSCAVVVTYSEPSATAVPDTATLTIGPVTSASMTFPPVTAQPPVSYTFALSGTAAGATAITVSGTTTFPSTTVGGSSAPQAITITNSGTAALTLSGITASNSNIFPDTTGGPAPNPAHWCGFGSAAGGAPNTGSPISIAPGNSCVLNIIFAPNATGTLTGTIIINSNAPTSPTMIALSGFGTTAPIAPTITSTAPPGGTVGTPYSRTFTATGTTPITWSIATGTVPNGLSLNAASGVLSGTPTTAGTFGFLIQAANGTAPNATQNVTITIAPAAVLPTVALSLSSPTATTGSAIGLVLNISNPGTATLTTGTFTFTYPAGVVTATIPGIVNSCGGTVTAAAGSTSVSASGLALGPSGTCAVGVSVSSATAGSYIFTFPAGGFSASTGSNSSASSATLTVSATPSPAVTLTPSFVNFGTRTVNTTSPSSTVSLGNSGTALLSIVSITSSGDFAFTTTCPLAPSTLAVGIACPINITFTPLTATALTGSITIVSNAPGSPHTITLSGSGSAAAVPGISLTPTSLTFAAQTVNTVSSTRNVVVTNTGFANLTLSSITASSPFGRVPLGTVTPPDCGASLAPGSSCQIGVNFSPTASGSFTGQISITDNAAGSPHSVALTGTGTPLPVAVISTSGALNFGDQVINSGNSTQALTISNTGAATLTISAITLTGTNVANFTLASQSGCTSIAPAGSCTLTVTFAATTTGAKTAQINITSNAQNAALVNAVGLTGNGILSPRAIVSLSASAVGYGNVIFGGATPNQIISLTNSGGQAMSILDIVVTGDFIQMNNCGTSLASLSSCTISILFTPLGQGARSGELILTTSAGTTPNHIQLSGTGCRWFSQAQSRFFLTSCG